MSLIETFFLGRLQLNSIRGASAFAARGLPIVIEVRVDIAPLVPALVQPASPAVQTSSG